MTYKAALAGLDLGGGKAVIIGDPAATSPRRCCAPTAASCSRCAAATTPPATWAPTARTWTDRARVRLRDRPHRRARWCRRLLGAHGVRRLPGHARRRRGDLGRADAARPHGRRRRRRQGRPAPGRAPARGRRGGRRHRRLDAAAVDAVAAAHPEVTVRGRHRSAGRAADSTSTPPARSVARSPTTWSRRSPPGSCAGPRTTSSPTTGIEKLLAERGDPLRPGLLVNAGGLIQVADELEGFSFERARQRADEDLRHHPRGVRARRRRGHAAGGRRRPARRAAHDAVGRTARALARLTGVAEHPASPGHEGRRRSPGAGQTRSRTAGVRAVSRDCGSRSSRTTRRTRRHSASAAVARRSSSPCSSLASAPKSVS